MQRIVKLSLKLLAGTLLLLFSLNLVAQDKAKEKFTKAERGSTSKIDLKVSDSINFFFPMTFADKEFVSVVGLARLKPEQLQTVELFYTDFPKGKDFEKLNLSRFRKLFEVAPSLFDAEHIQWKITAQTECYNKSEAQDLFHGFVLRKKPAEVKEEKKTDKPKISIQELAKKDPIVRDSLKFWELLDKGIAPTKDSAVLKILTRFPNWKDLLIVNDWTGSMYEFGLEVLLWYKINEIRQKDIKRIVFFNDGDSLPDNKKIIGKTGGIYLSDDSITLEGLISKMVACMRGGYGGDIPENDLEAVLAGLESCPDCKEVILIADSRSLVRDMALLSKIKKPVHVILCGSDKGVVLDYVKIAYETGGTIHTIEQDIMTLASYTDGKRIIDFAGVKLIFGSGQFEVFNKKKHIKQLSSVEKKKVLEEEKKKKKSKTKSKKR